jgi:hypothetical protein
MQKSLHVKLQKKMQEALEAYRKDKNSVQEFYPYTQALSQWLQTKEKVCK